ncbi:hypothetical protein GDI2540 [Gluconacetobacter diazotrophicus PA1 5]|uniref:Uncharacterized protein n=1 Tax=Gluconacetobacter diazotrophicus (strain ATCC 49037 / DSM 5601 / CCUG 37298 / CIP 103539 / LMG 7603 / PAl5) TaxID=272568 RepID=A9HNQ1_GLUDA|nr:hypothetical protein GDI2540 [Gluconacetobacter diazotrophicus PA1 5]
MVRHATVPPLENFARCHASASTGVTPIDDLRPRVSIFQNVPFRTQDRNADDDALVMIRPWRRACRHCRRPHLPRA